MFLPQLNLYGTCPFWTENHFCTNEDCSVATLDEVKKVFVVSFGLKLAILCFQILNRFVTCL